MDKSKDNQIEVKEIENTVMSVLYSDAPDIAREYSSYKMDKERAKENPTEIEKVLYVNDDIKYENGNKNPNLVHIKNAYLAENQIRYYTLLDSISQEFSRLQSVIK